MSTPIHGSANFQIQVLRALDEWRRVDPDANRLIECIESINEHHNEFRVYATPSRDVFISSRVAFWENVSPELQIHILATYLAHEAVHCYGRLNGSTHWNDDTGEYQAINYQKYLAGLLKVPEVYVTDPIETLDNVVEVRPAGPIYAVLIAAAVSLILVQTLKNRTSRRKLLSR